MKKELAKSIISLIGALVFSLLFYKSSLGINGLLFSLGIGILLYKTKADLFAQKQFIWVLLVHLSTAVLILLQNSNLAQTLYCLSFITLIGYAQIPTLRFLFYGLILGLSSIASAPLNFYQEFKKLKWGKWGLIKQWGQLALIPSFIGLVFFGIYYWASPEFAKIFNQLTWLWTWNGTNPNYLYLGYFLFGTLIMITLLWPSLYRPLIENMASQQQLQLSRIRKQVSPFFKFLALKRAYIMAILSFSILNTLLLLVNLTDLRYVWLDFETKSAAELSNYVHAGTNLLIFAIAMAILVCLYYFRRNLNFYPDSSQLLQKLAYIWLLQNVILCLSVAMRNYHYFSRYGLTQLRIGVMLFLLIVIIGLFYTYRKIRYQKSNFYLLVKNAWSLLFVLMLTASVNWDILISRYNLFYARTEYVDAYYLINDLSHKNTYFLKNHESMLAQRASQLNSTEMERKIEEKKEDFIRQQHSKNWRSWNLSDWKLKQQLK